MKIAICDDEQECIDNIKELLTKYFPKEFNYSVNTYLSGEKFLEDLRTNNADIVFMDIELSALETGLTGLAVVQRLKALDYRPIVFLLLVIRITFKIFFVFNHFSFCRSQLKRKILKKILEGL